MFAKTIGRHYLKVFWYRFYLKINVKVFLNFLRVVWQFYCLWLYGTGLLMLNILIASELLLTKEIFVPFISSIIFTAMLVPLSFLIKYRPGYKAFRDDSSLQLHTLLLLVLPQFVARYIGCSRVGSNSIWSL